MKHDCKTLQDRMLEVLFAEKASLEETAIQKESDACPVCRREWESLRATRALLDQNAPADPPEGFLQELKIEVRRRAALEGATDVPAPGRSLTGKPLASKPKWTLFPAWAPSALAAAVLLAVGVWIGGQWASRPDRLEPSAGMAMESSEGEALRLARDYVARSQALLLGLARMEPQVEGTGGLNLRYQKEVSRRLVRQGEKLKQKLDRERHRRLLELVGQLETILLRIAHLNSSRIDSHEVDSIRQGLDESGVLVGIDLERFRLRRRLSAERKQI